ncbi:hypothetical protein GGF43_003101 [Coemansia sp. RSA 2618]|nr:hypothetical protein GGF43_003101 [Coemansia sp. RSA 2618]
MEPIIDSHTRSSGPTDFTPPPKATPATREATRIDPILTTALSTNVSDRQFVLETEQLVRQFLAQHQTRRLAFSAQNSYRRLLLHKLADYYQLTHVVVGAKRNEIAFYKKSEEDEGVYLQLPRELGVCVVMAADCAEGEQSVDAAGEEVGFTHILVKRNNREKGECPNELGARDPSRGGARQGGVPEKSIEERQAEYERARAEIFQDPEQSTLR